jgi:hypothetical protein
VTLTLYVVVGSCQSDQNISEWPPKNINVEPVDKDIIPLGGKHYVVKVSTNPLSQRGIKRNSQGFSTINIPGAPGLLNIPDPPLYSSYYSLPDFYSSVIYEKDRIPVPKEYASCLYKDPLSASAGEIRAGPLA